MLHCACGITRSDIEIYVRFVISRTQLPFARSVKLHQRRDMSIRYRFEIQRLEELQMQRHRRDPLLATKHQVNSHQMIIDRVRKVVRGKPWRLIAALQEHNVVYVVLMFDASADQVDELNSRRWTIRRAKANRVRLSRCETTDYLSLREIPAARPGSVIARVDLCRLLLFRHLSQLFTRAKTWVRLIAAHQLARKRVISQLAL